VAYGSLLGERRRGLHARIVEELERLSADRLSEQVEQLAHHAFRAEAWENAVLYLSQAGDRAAARSAYREAVACREQALAAFEHRPESREKTEQAIDLRFALRPMLVPLNEFQRMAEVLGDAEVDAHVLGDRNRLGRAAAYLTEAARETGELDRSRATGERAIVMAADLCDVLLEFEATFHLGLTHVRRAEYRLAVERFRRCIELHARLRGEDLRLVHGTNVGALSWLAFLLAGQPERAQEQAGRVLELAQQNKERGNEAQALWLLGETFSRRELPDVEQAERRYREALALADELDMRPSSPTATSASANSTGARASARRRRSTSPPRRRCTARWA
jgi:tetratricopeptide (TPR) repeat protein